MLQTGSPPPRFTMPSQDPRHHSAVAESERRLRFLDELAQATRTLGEPLEVMHVTASLLGRHLAVSRCAYAQVLADQDQFDLIGDYNDGVDSMVGRFAFSDFGDDVLEHMRADQPYVNNSVQGGPRIPGTDVTTYELSQIRSVICVPLHKDGRLVAAMAVHQDVPRVWTPDETSLVQMVVARCWESLDRIRVDKALREAHQRLSLAMEAGELGDWEWDAATGLMVLGDRAADIYGVPQGVPIPRDEMRLLIHPDERGAAAANAAKAFAERGTYRIEYRVNPAGGGPQRWVLAQGKPSWAADGSVTGMVGVVHDITHQRQAQEERRQLLESEMAARMESERANAMKDEFLATLSHELRTPLSAILGWVHILRRKLPAELADLQKGVDVIERSTRMQTRLIEDLLDMSRVVSGKLRLDVQPVAPITFVEAAVDILRPAADAAGVHIETELDAAAGPVSGDAARLQQVVWNLVANAVKFTPRGGAVKVSLARVTSHVEITVADTGAGIRADFLPYIFDRFRQADGSTSRRHGGLGLGLSIVHHLMELHGGSVLATSDGPGKGATFIVSLPIKSVHLNTQDGGERVHPEVEDPRGPVVFDPDELKGLRVLVVDDEPDARELLQRVLEESGAQVVAADSAQAAMAVMQSAAAARFDVLVSDIGMPGTDGYELLRQVRDLGAENGGALPAIALTAFARPEDRIKAVRGGFNVHMAKPVEPSEIVATVASLAGRSPLPS